MTLPASAWANSPSDSNGAMPKPDANVRVPDLLVARPYQPGGSNDGRVSSQPTTLDVQGDFPSWQQAARRLPLGGHKRRGIQAHKRVRIRSYAGIEAELCVGFRPLLERVLP